MGTILALVDWQPKPMAGLALSCLRFCQALVALPEAVQARLSKCCVPNRAQHRTHLVRTEPMQVLELMLLGFAELLIYSAKSLLLSPLINTAMLCTKTAGQSLPVLP